MLRTPLFVLGLLTCLLSATPPQERGSTPDDQARLRANLERKLAKDFVTAGGWVLDYDEARARAAKQNKLLFVYFTRTFAP